MDNENDRKMMTDREIIQGLIARNNQVTEEFFFRKCRPLFHSIIHLIYNYEVDYDEFVNELYAYLMENDASKLRNFQYRSSIYQWLKVVAVRYFIKKRDTLIEESSQNTLYSESEQADDNNQIFAKYDLERLLHQMPNQRYAHVIRRLMLEDTEPDELAKEMKITTANLYNIKRRAMVSLARVALKDIENYGK